MGKEVRALKDQFDGIKSLLEQQIDMLQKRVAEIQELYNQRPSLEEDLKRIAALEADLREKDAVARKCLEDMKFYKLELVNREQNYNKVFGIHWQRGTLFRAMLLLKCALCTSRART